MDEQSNTLKESKGTGIKKRNPLLVLILFIITLGMYSLYWIIVTTLELRRNTQSAPNPWLLLLILVPFVNIIVSLFYLWKYSKAIEELTGFNPVVNFVLFVFVSPIGMLLSQNELNTKAD